MEETFASQADARTRTAEGPSEHDQRQTGAGVQTGRFTRRLLLGLAFVSAIAAAASGSLIVDPLLERIPEGWSWEANYVGPSAPLDAATGKFPDEPPILQYRRELRIEGPGPTAGTVRMIDDFAIQDPLTGKPDWRYTVHPVVERATGLHADPAYRDQYFVFPRNVEQKTYNIRWNYVEGLPMRFVKQDRIEDVPVYLFEYVGRGEYTESYAGTRDYVGVKVAPGQEIKCADDQFYLRMWVEPLSGQILKVDEGCEAGDYIFDIATGRRLAPVLLWSGKMEGSDVLARADGVRVLRLWIMAANHLQIGLALLAVIFAIAGLAYGRTRS